jgi:signal transduction histidine kinase
LQKNKIRQPDANETFWGIFMTPTEQIFTPTHPAFHPIEGMKDAVLLEWLKQARDKVPPAKELDDKSLLNSLPQFLDFLISSLMLGSPDWNEIYVICEEHASQRANLPHYDLQHILLDYNILRKILFRAVDLENLTGVADVRDDILDIIQAGESAAVKKYSQIAYEREKVNSATIRSGEERLGLALDFLKEDVTKQKILEQQLRENVKRLEAEKNLREQFVSTLSHDLRTPLTAARLNLQLLENHSSDKEKVQASTKKIQTCLARVDRMIQDLLDANRIRAGQPIAVDISICDLYAITQEAVNELATIHGERFEILGPSDIQGFWGKESLRRIFENLLSNAIKYGDPHKKIKIILKAEEDWIEIAIHNEGKQIPENQIDRLFEPFHREQSS